VPDEFDVIVLGAGPAGENVAGRCADGGLTAVIVEARLVGGECSYWGCIPSKTLLRPGDVLAAARRVPGAAQAITGTIDVEAAFERRDAMTSDWDDTGALQWLDKHHVDLVRGHGRLAGPRVVSVTARDGTTRRLTARLAVAIAVGTSAAMPPIDGLADAKPWTNEQITSTHTVPGRLLVLGGGAIGLEMAQAFARLGSAVTVLEGAGAVLAREEPFAGLEVAAAFAAEGIAVHTSASVASVRRGDSVVVTLADGRAFEGDELLVSVGRTPHTADLGLDAVGLGALAGRYLPVDDRMRVEGGDGWLYAVGDCNGRALLTHVGKYQARICGDVIMGKDAADRRIVPRVTFTDPQVCAVGMTEAQAREDGIAVRVVSVPTGGVAGAAVSGIGITGTSLLVVDEQRRTVVGATFTGPAVQELLHSATVAIAGSVTLDDLWHAVPSFPTVSEVWLRLLEAYGL
jgi:pyruvate/2-oxoglutarate dehydrogenase complex dihydrolipoamide dehydrogenase (E3) component